jgi:AraC-like DNA-binding protein
MIEASVCEKIPGLILPWGKTTGEAAFQEWSETVATIFDLDAEKSSVDNFKFGFSAWHLGSLVLGVSQSDPIRFRRTAQTIAKSSIDHYLVQVYQTEGLTSSTEGEDIHVAPGDVWILDLARTSEINETRFKSVNLAIPRSLLEPLVKDPDGLHGLKLDRQTPLGCMLSRFLVDLAELAPQMTITEAASVAESTIQLIAGCAGPNIGAKDLVRGGFANATLTALKRFIDDQLSNPSLGVDLLCKQFGMSRASLYRLSEPLGGIHAYIRQRRLARCFQELVKPAAAVARISQVAFRWGFADEATFSRAFRDAYGLSPSEARGEGLRLYAGLLDNPRTGAPGETELSRWIRSLMRH